MVTPLLLVAVGLVTLLVAYKISTRRCERCHEMAWRWKMWHQFEGIVCEKCLDDLDNKKRERRQIEKRKIQLRVTAGFVYVADLFKKLDQLGYHEVGRLSTEQLQSRLENGQSPETNQPYFYIEVVAPAVWRWCQLQALREYLDPEDIYDTLIAVGGNQPWCPKITLGWILDEPARWPENFEGILAAAEVAAQEFLAAAQVDNEALLNYLSPLPPGKSPARSVEPTI